MLTPNPSYGGSPKPYANEIDVNTYTSYDAELNAVKTGALDIMVGFDPSQIAADAARSSSRASTSFGGPSWGWFGGIYNFEDGTDHFDKVIAQLYARQALAYLTDQPAIIKGIYKGAAVRRLRPDPVGADVAVRAAERDQPAVPVQPGQGRVAAEGPRLEGRAQRPVDVRQARHRRRVSAAPGFRPGTPFKFVWANQPESVSSTGALESEALASDGQAAGRHQHQPADQDVQLPGLQLHEHQPRRPQAEDDWGVNNYGGLFIDYYPTADGVWNHPGTGSEHRLGRRTRPAPT